MQKWPYGGKGDFVKMSVSYIRELYFEGSGGPESVVKGAQKGSQKRDSSWMKNKSKNEAKKASKGDLKSMKNGSKKRRKQLRIF